MPSFYTSNTELSFDELLEEEMAFQHAFPARQVTAGLPSASASASSSSLQSSVLPSQIYYQTGNPMMDEAFSPPSSHLHSPHPQPSPLSPLHPTPAMTTPTTNATINHTISKNASTEGNLHRYPPPSYQSSIPPSHSVSSSSPSSSPLSEINPETMPTHSTSMETSSKAMTSVTPTLPKHSSHSQHGLPREHSRQGISVNSLNATDSALLHSQIPLDQLLRRDVTAVEEGVEMELREQAFTTAWGYSGNHASEEKHPKENNGRQIPFLDTAEEVLYSSLMFRGRCFSFFKHLVGYMR